MSLSLRFVSRRADPAELDRAPFLASRAKSEPLLDIVG
jgi:hypothetical protein